MNKKLFVLTLMILVAVPLAFAAFRNESNVSLGFNLDQGTLRTLNETGIQFTSSVRHGTQPQVLEEQNTISDITPSLIPLRIIDTRNLSKLKWFTTEPVWSAASVVINNTHGMIDFTSAIDLSHVATLNLDSEVNISARRVQLNQTMIPELNSPARITIRGVQYSNVRILKDGANCVNCTVISYSANDVVFDVPGFSVYEIVNGSAVPAIRVSKAVNVQNASMTVSGELYNGTYPQGITIDIGNDNSVEWSYPGMLNTTQTFANFSLVLRNAVPDCTCAGCHSTDLACLVDIIVNTTSQGSIKLGALNITQEIRNVSIEMNENTTLIDLNDYFYDRDDDVLTFSGLGNQNVTVHTNNATGIATLIPPIGFTGNDTVVFTANDSINTTRSNNITINVSDTKPPAWSLNASNATVVLKNRAVQFNVTWADASGVNVSVFAWNGTAAGAVQNDTALSCNGAGTCVHSITKTIGVEGGSTVCWKFAANDTAGRSNQTDQWCFMTTNAAPTPVSVTLNTTDYPYNTTHANLTCYGQASDDDTTTLTAYWRWYNNSILYSSGSTSVSSGAVTNITGLNHTVTNISDEWTCGVKFSDISTNASETNASLTINANLAPNITMIYPHTNGSFVTNLSGGATFTIAEPLNQYLNVSVDDRERDASLVWYQNGSRMLSSDNQNSTLWLGNYSQSGSYNITLVASDLEGSSSFSWNLTVNNTNIRLLNITPQSNVLLNISWASVSNASNYTVYMATTPTGAFTITNTSNTSMYSENVLDQYQKRFYKIVANTSLGLVESNTVGFWQVPLQRKTSSTTKNWISVPLNSSTYLRAADILEQQGITSVSYWDAAAQQAVTCNHATCPTTCTDTTCNFALQAGKMYEVTINGSGATAINLTLTGEIYPGTQVQLVKKASGSRNWISIKPNSTYTTARDIALNIGSSLNTISIWDSQNQIAQGYIRFVGNIFIGKNFAADASKGYEVWVNTNATWTQN